MGDGISNSQIEEAFKNLNDEDIGDSFVGAFPSNHMKKFINPASMIFQKKGKYSFKQIRLHLVVFSLKIPSFISTI